MVAGNLAAAPPAIGKGFVEQLRQFSFHVVGGRIGVWAPPTRRQATASMKIGDREESLSVTIGDGGPQFDYSLTTPVEHFSVELRGNGELAMLHESRSTKSFDAVEFLQQSQGPISLRVGDEQRAEASLWQLLLAETPARRARLVELLQTLKKQWPLDEQAAQLEEALFRLAGEQRDQPHDVWRQWVDDLGNSSYSLRAAADRRLRQAGPQALVFLEGVGLDGLDSEQRFRIRRIVGDLTNVAGEDDPERIAPALLSQARMWRILLERDDPQRRRAASEQLARLLGQPLDFDPDANAEQRTAQLAALETRFAELRPVDLTVEEDAVKSGAAQNGSVEEGADADSAEEDSADEDSADEDSAQDR